MSRSCSFRQWAAALSLPLVWIGGASAQDADPPPAKPDPAIVSPEFVEHLDVDAASLALRDDDDAALLEIADKLGAAERAANKQNAIPAVVFYQGAIRAAQARHDAKALATIEARVNAATGLKPQEKKALLNMIAVAKKVAASPRKVDLGPGLKASDVTPESASLYGAFSREIRTIQEYGTEEELQSLANAVKELSEFHPKQQEHLLKLIGDARVAMQQKGAADPSLAKLVAASRYISGGTYDVRIVGPDVVKPGATVSMGVVPSASRGSKPGTLFLRVASSNVKLVAPNGSLVPTLAVKWTGKSQTIRVKITAGGSPASITCGLASNNQTCRWQANVR